MMRSDKGPLMICIRQQAWVVLVLLIGVALRADQMLIESGAQNSASQGAILETDADIDGVMRRAREYLQGGAYREAAQLLQHVIDQSGQKLTTEDDRRYFPVSVAAEELIAGMPREGLAAYRVEADAAAGALLSGRDDWMEEGKLREVVRRYFLSSIGDDAAFGLACLLIDRYDFIGARRLLQRVRWAYPDSDLDRAGVLLRLGVVYSRLGDVKGAEAVLGEMEEKAGGETELSRLLGVEISRAGDPGVEAGVGSAAWAMAMGSPGREGHMADLPTDPAAAGLWSVHWEQVEQVVELEGEEQPGNLRRIVGVNAARRGVARPQTRAQRVARWDRGGWTPAGQMVYGNGLVFYKTSDAIGCVQADLGRLLWKSESAPLRMDQTQDYLLAMRSVNFPDKPGTNREVMEFGDRLGRSMSLIGGAVYELAFEGVAAEVRQRVFMGPNGRVVQGTVPNALVCHEAQTGKVRWRLAGGADEGEGKPGARFMGAPLPCGGRLLVPVQEGEDLFLEALDPLDGRVVWRTFLCGGAAGDGPRLTPVGTAVDGDEVYIATGRGVVLCLDGVDGSIRWATRYERSCYPTGPVQGWGRTTVYQAWGWDEDVVVVRNGVVVVLPTDHSGVLGLDGNTGEIRYHGERDTSRYCVGVSGDGLFVAGPNLVRRYEVSSGKLVWEAMPERSVGRGMLGADSVYIPLRDSVLRLDSVTGRQTGLIRVEASDSDPLGNLYCDGDRLYVVGPGRVYALVDSERRLADLSRQIDRGDIRACIERARLLMRLGKVDSAVKDLRAAASLAAGGSRIAEPISLELVDAFLRIGEESPYLRKELLDYAELVATTRTQRTRIRLARAGYELEQGGVAEAVDMYLAVAMDQSGLMAPVEHEGGAVEARASLVAVRALEGIASEGKGEAAGVDLEALAKQALAAIRADSVPGIEGLVAIARSYPNTPASFEAAWLAARRSRDGGQFERGESILREASGAPFAARAAAGLAALARYHEEQGWFGVAEREWRRLRSEFAGVGVVLDSQVVPAEALAEKALAALAEQPAYVGKSIHRKLAPPNKLLWREKNWDRFVMVGLDGGEPTDFTREHFLVVNPLKSKLQCKVVRTNRLIWEASLPRRTGAVNDLIVHKKAYQWGGNSFSGGDLTRDGHVGLLQGDWKLWGISLLSGKKIWEASGGDEDVPPCEVVGAETPVFSGVARVSAGDGVVARYMMAPTSGADQVEVRDAATGEPMWTRRFDKQAVQGVWVHGGSVNVVLDGGRGIMACDRLTGRKIGLIDMEDRRLDRPLLWTRAGVVFRDARGLTLKSLQTGKTIWTLTVGGANGGVAVPDDSTLAITGETREQAWLVDMKTGKVRVEVDVSADGLEIEGIALGQEGREMVVTAGSEDRAVRLITFDAVTGGVVSTVTMEVPSSPDQPSHGVSAAIASVYDGVVPVLARVPAEGNERSQTNLWKIGFHNRIDGKLAPGYHLPVPRKDGMVVAVTDPPMMVGDVLLVMAEEGVLAFGYEAGQASKQKDQD